MREKGDTAYYAMNTVTGESCGHFHHTKKSARGCMEHLGFNKICIRKRRVGGIYRGKGHHNKYNKPHHRRP